MIQKADQTAAAVTAKATVSGKKLVISEMAGIVHVTDYSGNMERIETFLHDVERSVRKQVMIQAHIVEVTLNDGYKLGIDWEYPSRRRHRTFFYEPGAGTITLRPSVFVYYELYRNEKDKLLSTQ